MKKRKGDEETNAETWKPAKKRRKMNSWRDYIIHEIHDSMGLAADFTFPKINSISHWVEQIRRYGALQKYPDERHDQAHETNLKDC